MLLTEATIYEVTYCNTKTDEREQCLFAVIADADLGDVLQEAISWFNSQYPDKDVVGIVELPVGGAVLQSV